MELIIGFLILILIMRVFIGVGRLLFDFGFWMIVGIVLVLLLALV